MTLKEIITSVVTHIKPRLDSKLDVTGVAASANKLATPRNLGVALGSTGSASFDGSSNQTSIPVTGTLAVTHGGTGGTTKDSARQGIGIYSGTALPDTAGYAEGDIFLLYEA